MSEKPDNLWKHEEIILYFAYFLVLSYITDSRNLQIYI